MIYDVNSQNVYTLFSLKILEITVRKIQLGFTQHFSTLSQEIPIVPEKLSKISLKRL